MCHAEQILTSNKEYQEDYCLLANGTCVTRSASVLQFFYDDATCSLLDQARIDQGWAALQGNVFFVDKHAFTRGYACKARSIIYLGTPLAGYDETSKLGDDQALEMQDKLGGVMEQSLWRSYDMEGLSLIHI